MNDLAFSLAVSYLVLLAPLAVLGLHKSWMVVLWWRKRHPTPPPTTTATPMPMVTVQLPVYNERFVVDRLIRAVTALDYPIDRFEIQILDDSTDDTTAIIANILADLPPGPSVHHIRRPDRVGFKAGALAHGMTTARGELIAIFDADFLPPPDFLTHTVPQFADPEVGLAQARWGHTNREHSVLTQAQALLLDGHFRIEQPARANNGCLFNFNGTAGVFRRRCIEDAGGWQHDTLTEDMDLSYRAQLRGWRFVFLGDLRCPAELPVDMNGFLTQQHRWAKGSIQTARKLLGAVWRSELPLIAKIESLFHLLGNLTFPLLLGLIIVAMPLQLARYSAGSSGDSAAAWPLTWLLELPLLFATLSVLFYYGMSQLTLGRLSAATLLRLPLVLSVGAGACINNTAAVLAALRRDPGEFRRTPKNTPATPQARTSTYYSPRGLMPLFELLLGSWAITTASLAGLQGLWSTAILHGLFGAGLLWVGWRSLLANRHIKAALPIALIAGCSGGSGGSTSTPIKPPGRPPEIVASRARIGAELRDTQVIFATRQGLSQQKLRSTAGKEFGVRVHPDGIRVLFTRQRKSGDERSLELFVATLDRSDLERRLTFNNVLDDGGCWSPDGEHLIFSSRSSDNRDLWRMQAKGQDLQRLTSGEFDDRDPDWHATGVIFSRQGRPTSGSGTDSGADPAQLFIMDENGAGLRAVTDGGTGDGDFEPAWAPDGKSVLFVRRASEQQQVLMHLVLGTTTPTVLGDAAGVDRFPRWSPHADRIFVARSRPADGLAGLRLYGSKPDGTQPQLIFPDARFAYLGFDPTPAMGVYEPPDPSAIDVDERTGEITVPWGFQSRGSRESVLQQDGRTLGIATRTTKDREAAGLILTQHLEVADPLTISSVHIRVTAAATRIDGDSKLRVAIRNTVEQRYDTVIETTPVDTSLRTYEFSISSLAHVDRDGRLRVEVIADLAPGAAAELLVDAIAIEVRAR